MYPRGGGGGRGPYINLHRFTFKYLSLLLYTFAYLCLPLPTLGYICAQCILLSYLLIHCVVVCGDVGTVGKKIPLTTLWVGVVKGIQFVDTVRLGGMV